MEQNLLLVKLVKISLKANGAESGPPLGTILGNLGVNTVKFCKEFNAYTKDLPSYFLLKVFISIFENRSFKFYVELPSTGYILSLLKFERFIEINSNNFILKKKFECILLSDLVKVAKLKFPTLSIKKSFLMV